MSLWFDWKDPEYRKNGEEQLEIGRNKRWGKVMNYDTRTICDLADEMVECRDRKEREKLATLLKELSAYDEFFIADLQRYINYKKLFRECQDWVDMNGSENSGIRKYDKIQTDTKWVCGVEV